MKRRPLRPGKPPVRRTPLRAVSPDRERKREERGVYGDYHAWIGTLPCLLWDHPEHVCQPGTVKGHHVKHAKNNADMGNEVPLCRRAHTVSPLSVHRLGKETFAERWGLEPLEVIAERYAERWHNLQREAG